MNAARLGKPERARGVLLKPPCIRGATMRGLTTHCCFLSRGAARATARNLRFGLVGTHNTPWTHHVVSAVLAHAIKF